MHRKTPFVRATAQTRMRATRVVIVSLFSALLVVLASPASAQEYIPLNLQLIGAARAGNVDNVKKLLAQGAAINARNRLGETPLVIAIKRGHDMLAAWLIEQGADVKQASLNGVTPLMAAAFDGKTELARALLHKGADPFAVDRVRKPAMVYAAGNGHAPVVALLLEAGVGVNQRYSGEQTALMWAAGFGHDGAVALLLERGADAALVDDRGWTAAKQARENGHLALAQRLDSPGAR